MSGTVRHLKRAGGQLSQPPRRLRGILRPGRRAGPPVRPLSGGILALDYALDHPENVKTLVLIGTPHKVPKGAFALQNVVFRFLPKSTFASMAFNKRDTFALGNSMKDLDFSGRLGELRCPTLILCGEKDGANLQSARFLAEHIPGAELRVIENAGHVVNEENPRALAERLNEFYTLHA